LDDLVVQLELELSPQHEVELLLRLVPVPVRAFAARVLRHSPMCQRDLLCADRVRDATHLAGIVAEPVVDIREVHDLIFGALRVRRSAVRAHPALLRSVNIEHLAEASRNRLVLIACILGSSIVFVDGSVVNVALLAIQRDLGGGLALQQWVVDAYLLTLGSLILVGGSLGDLFGGKRIFSIGVASVGGTSAFYALAVHGPLLID